MFPLLPSPPLDSVRFDSLRFTSIPPVCIGLGSSPHVKKQYKKKVEGRLKQLQDDYDTLSDQARFSQSRSQELEADLERSAEALRRAVAAGTARACVAQRRLLEAEASLSAAEEALEEAERRAEGEGFFRLAQEAASARAREACADRDREIECLAEELGDARGYAEGVRALLVAREEEVVVGGGGGEWTVGGGVGEGGEGTVEAELREAVVGGAVMCRELMGEHESAMERVRGLEQMVDELVEDEDRLVEEVCGLQHRIEELEVTMENDRGEGGGCVSIVWFCFSRLVAGWLSFAPSLIQTELRYVGCVHTPLPTSLAAGHDFLVVRFFRCFNPLGFHSQKERPIEVVVAQSNYKLVETLSLLQYIIVYYTLVLFT